MNGRIVAAVAFVLLVALGAGLFLMTHERVSERRYVGMSGEAASNRLLAAQRLAVKLGRKASDAKSLAALESLPAGGVLVLGRFRQSIPPATFDRILRWVDAGGLLMVEAESEDGPDALLDALGVERNAPPRKQQAVGVEVVLPWSEEPLRAVLPRQQTLDTENDPAFALGDAAGTRILGIDRGKGHVVVFAGFDPIENRGIGLAENATLFWSLVEWGPGTGDLVFVTRPGKFSLWRWLLDHAPLALLSAAILVVLWLWRIIVRFGPVAPDPAPARRRLTDHLVATARFLAREHRTDSLARAVRDEAMRDMARLVPRFESASRAEQVRLVAERFQCSPAEAQTLIAGTPHDLTAFTAFVRLAQRIRSARKDLITTSERGLA